MATDMAMATATDMATATANAKSIRHSLISK